MTVVDVKAADEDSDDDSDEESNEGTAEGSDEDGGEDSDEDSNEDSDEDSSDDSDGDGHGDSDEDSHYSYVSALRLWENVAVILGPYASRLTQFRAASMKELKFRTEYPIGGFYQFLPSSTSVAVNSMWMMTLFDILPLYLFSNRSTVGYPRRNSHKQT